jgi:EpsI family protein
VRSWPFAAAAVLVGATLAYTEARARWPESAAEKPLADLPATLGEWRAVRELPLTDKELDLLKLSDYVSRVYAKPGDEGPIILYIGYYRSQRSGSTYHSPLNCLPGSGWQIAATDRVAVPGAEGRLVKRLMIEKDTQRDVVLYWYHDRGRAITSEYAAKAYLIWDGLFWNRTDGALVRISARVTTTPEAATLRAMGFLTELWPALDQRLPAPKSS